MENKEESFYVYRATFFNKQGKRCQVFGNFESIASLSQFIEIDRQKLEINEKANGELEILYATK